MRQPIINPWKSGVKTYLLVAFFARGADHLSLGGEIWKNSTSIHEFEFNSHRWFMHRLSDCSAWNQVAPIRTGPVCFLLIEIIPARFCTPFRSKLNEIENIGVQKFGNPDMPLLNFPLGAMFPGFAIFWNGPGSDLDGRTASGYPTMHQKRFGSSVERSELEKIWCLDSASVLRSAYNHSVRMQVEKV